MIESIPTHLVLEKQNKKLAIFYDIALILGKSLDLKAVLDDVLEMIIDFMGVDAGVIYVINGMCCDSGDIPGIRALRI